MGALWKLITPKDNVAMQLSLFRGLSQLFTCFHIYAYFPTMFIQLSMSLSKCPGVEISCVIILLRGIIDGGLVLCLSRLAIKQDSRTLISTEIEKGGVSWEHIYLSMTNRPVERCKGKLCFDFYIFLIIVGTRMAFSVEMPWVWEEHWQYVFWKKLLFPTSTVVVTSTSEEWNLLLLSNFSIWENVERNE